MKKIMILIVALMFSVVANVNADEKAMKMDKAMMGKMISASIIMKKLEEDVTVEDAIESMKLRANTLNFKEVADLPLSEQVIAMGEKANFMRILAFCDALIANKMVSYNPIFAGFLPCRIAVIKDNEGQGWVITSNMDMMVDAFDLPADIQPLAEKVRDTINEIVDAGVNGDL